jgi:hypothetical protein
LEMASMQMAIYHGAQRMPLSEGSSLVGSFHVQPSGIRPPSTRPPSTPSRHTPSKHTPSKLQAHALQALQAEGMCAGVYAEGAHTDGAYAGGCSVKLWNNDLGRRVPHDERCQWVRKPQEPSPKTICQKPTAPRLQVLK